MQVLFSILAVLSMLYGLVAIVNNILYRKSGNSSMLNLKGGKLALIAGALLLLLTQSVYKVEGQEVGVRITPSGVSETPLYTGLHFITPFFDRVYPMDRTLWVYTFSKDQKRPEDKKDAEPIWASSSNKIPLSFDLSVAWSIDPAQAPYIYQSISEGDGGDYDKYRWIEENRIKSITKNAITSVVSNYTPDEIITTKRGQIQSEVFETIKKQFVELRLILHSVDMREIRFEEAYAKEISNTQVAEQQVRTLTNQTKQKEEQLKQAELDKQRTIKIAEADAEALRIKGNAVSSNPKIVEIEWINKWDGQLPTYMTNGNTSLLMGIGKGF